MRELTNTQIQVILTGTFGDGYIAKNGNSANYTTNSIHKQYMEKKGKLLGDLWRGRISQNNNGGFKSTTIYNITSKTDLSIQALHQLSLEEKLQKLDRMGLAMWFYDDGSLHKKNLFYNLCTHSFSGEEHREVLKPYFESLGLHPTVLTEMKEDGRMFCYLFFSKYNGAFEINKILSEYPIDCFSYKRWPEDDYQRWITVQQRLRDEGRTVSNRKFGDLMSELKRSSPNN